MRPLGAQRHLAVQEEQRLVELGVEVEAEGFPPATATSREVPLRVEHHGVILGTDGLDERVVRHHAGVRVGRDEARHDGEAQQRVGGRRRELKQRGGGSLSYWSRRANPQSKI